MYDNKIISLLSQTLEVDEDTVSSISRTESLEVIGLNSIRAIEIIVKLEDTFDIEVKDEDLKISNILTIDKINSFIDKYKDK